MVMLVGVVVGRPDKDPIHMQHRVEVDQVFLLEWRYSYNYCNINEELLPLCIFKLKILSFSLSIELMFGRLRLSSTQKLLVGGRAGVQDLRYDGRPTEGEEAEG